jgi:hypothetical protein
MKLHLKWSFSNRKLKKLDTVSFGIPAFTSKDGFVTCPGAGACVKFCFARHGFYTIPRVVNPREWNLAKIRAGLDSFEAIAVEDIRRIKQKVIRVHDSGDFFSQDYLDVWYRIAEKFPTKRFYAYTKSLHLDLWSRKPANFTIVQSRGGKYDHLRDARRSEAKIFLEPEELKKSGYVDSHLDDGAAIEGVARVGLLYHGTLRRDRTVLKNIA